MLKICSSFGFRPNEEGGRGGPCPNFFHTFKNAVSSTDSVFFTASVSLTALKSPRCYLADVCSLRSAVDKDNHAAFISKAVGMMMYIIGLM